MHPIKHETVHHVRKLTTFNFLLLYHIALNNYLIVIIYFNTLEKNYFMQCCRKINYNLLLLQEFKHHCGPYHTYFTSLLRVLLHSRCQCIVVWMGIWSPRQAYWHCLTRKEFVQSVGTWLYSLTGGNKFPKTNLWASLPASAIQRAFPAKIKGISHKLQNRDIYNVYWILKDVSLSF